MELNPQTAKLMKEWAAITSERMDKTYDKLGIGRWRFNEQSGRLVASTGNLRKDISNGWSFSGGMARFSHGYYGAFVDMGVGRGTKLGDVAFDSRFRGTGAESSGRRPKRWFSRNIYREINKLADLAKGIIGMDATAAIVDSLPKRIEL